MKQLILIAGGSCSGKGVVAQVVKDVLAEHGKIFEILSMDDYYVDVPLDAENRGMINHDVPEEIEWELLINQLSSLLNGKSVSKPEYSFEKKAKHEWKPFGIAEKDGLIVEGLHALNSALLSNFDAIRIFVDADDEIRWARRSARKREGGEDHKLKWRWENQVLPAHYQHVIPTKAKAHHVIENKYIDWDNITTPNTEPLRLEVKRILQELKLI